MGLKTAILGGSFDPVHRGHLYLLSCVLRMTDYRRILLVPTSISNFKQDTRSAATSLQRLEMLRLALGDFRDAYPDLISDKHLIIEDYEVKKGGVSYTRDTVLALKEKYQVPGPIGLIIGDDHLPRLGDWYGFDQLKEEVVFLVFRRYGIRCDIPGGACCVFLDNAVFDASSTEIRDGKREGELLSPRVEAYVREHALYC